MNEVPEDSITYPFQIAFYQPEPIVDIDGIPMPLTNALEQLFAERIQLQQQVEYYRTRMADEAAGEAEEE